MEKLFSALTLSDDGIYISKLPKSVQSDEIELRKDVASQNYSDYNSVISNSHSIPVMEHEVTNFLKLIPVNGFILDIGGCWGWHWKKIENQRPDVKIFIVDFVRENFIHAKNILDSSILNKNIFLIHADATNLPFPENSFDGVWTVQVFQHIPDFETACIEAHRVLKSQGVFVNFSLNRTPFIRLIYFILNKKFHMKGQYKNSYLLNKADNNQKKIICKVFKNEVNTEYTECMFHPELKLSFSGRENSIIGKLDSLLSGNSIISRFLARQCSFKSIKD
jgi:ubiquinone/menaquinone biosynthesis C-methylase UbiE